MSKEIPFDKSFASHEKSKFWSKINKLQPNEVFKQSNKKYWFDCSCGHIFDIALNHLSGRNQWCSYCCNPPKKLCDNDDCKQCFDKSFASHEKSKFWSIKNKLKPRQVFKSSGKEYIFDCICGHEFNISLDHMNHGRETWCSYCSSPSKLLCDNDECKNCFEKSFASNEKSKYWSDKNTLKPRQVFKSSANKYLFDCDNCKHEFIICPDKIRINRWCSYCCNPPKKLCDNVDCKLCFEKSFASHEKSKFWSDKNTLKPRQVFKWTNNNFHFICIQGHVFYQMLTDTMSGCWCPYCVNKTEQKLYDALIPHYPQLNQQFKVEWCKNITYLPFDFVLEEYKIIIELDGLQHFEQVSNWQSPEETHLNDVYKMKCANENGYSVIRLLQTDVFYDTYDWLMELRENIEKIKLERIIENIYMCKDNEYAIFA
jgi:very-short-patch-repair endonuclease